MKRIAVLTLVVVSLSLVAATNLYVSQPQAMTEGMLEQLGFERVPDTSGRIGGPGKFKISKETIKHLEHWQSQGKHVVTTADGAIEVK